MCKTKKALGLTRSQKPEQPEGYPPRVFEEVTCGEYRPLRVPVTMKSEQKMDNWLSKQTNILLKPRRKIFLKKFNKVRRKKKYDDEAIQMPKPARQEEDEDDFFNLACKAGKAVGITTSPQQIGNFPREYVEPNCGEETYLPLSPDSTSSIAMKKWSKSRDKKVLMPRKKAFRRSSVRT